MMIVRTIAAVRAALASRDRASVGFVPTMGALHDGHVTLLRVARAGCKTLVTSVFVNPLQFNDPADLAAYPRNEVRDAALAEKAGTDVFFAPAVNEIYPSGDATAVEIGGAALGFEGEMRPGHFRGVATVCLKLFNIVQPAYVYLGQKDAQQVAVLSQMVRDFCLPLEVRVLPTVREADGLALSSRNVRLSADERRRAAAIPMALRAALAADRRGADPVAAARAALTDLVIDYVGIAPFGTDRTLVVAVRAGATRLIDNVPLGDPERAGLTT